MCDFASKCKPPRIAKMSSPEAWTVRRLLEWTVPFFTRKQVDSPRLASEMLLAHVLGVPRIKLYTDYERPLSEKELTTYRALVQRAVEQEPVEYLTGKAHFFGLEFEVNRDVLIPRPDTETLVEHMLQQVRATPGMEHPRVLDLCTGSGCIAAAIAQRLKESSVIAIDVSPEAAAVAKRNIERLKLSDRVEVLVGDLYEPLKDRVDAQPFDLITSNPPYIASAQIDTLDRSVRDYEPHIALDGGFDGLAVHRRILAGATERLQPGGYIYQEIAFDQADAALKLIEQFDAFIDAKILKDHAGNDRVLRARINK
jgi:release factor glutamine methyltransferase